MISDRQFLIDCKQFHKSNMSIRQFVKCCSSDYSKTGFHKQIHDRLPNLDKRLYINICEKLKQNFKKRHSFSVKER